MKAFTKNVSRPHEQSQPTGTQVGDKYGVDVNIIGGGGSGGGGDASAANQVLQTAELVEIKDSLKSVISATNSTTTPLAGGAVFTGTAVDITGYSSINILTISDVDSASGGLTVEFSPDGTNWDHSHSTTYTLGSGKGYVFNCEGQFARVRYTNGGTAQSFFRLQTILKTSKLQSSLYTLSQSINSNMFAELSRSVITGETTAGGGGYVNVKVTPSGAVATEVGGTLPSFAAPPDVNVALLADTDSVETRKLAMKQAIDEASATVTYLGEAALGSGLGSAVWRIKRITVSGTVTLIEWASTGTFNQIWNNRASLTYN